MKKMLETRATRAIKKCSFRDLEFLAYLLAHLSRDLI
jgi:hypothetical protein